MGLLCLLLAGCARSRPAAADLQPLTAEGGARQFLAVELVRTAHVTGLERAVNVSACQWHVGVSGALFGDHWGWCEDFRILPRNSPGYLLLTTQFSGEMSDGYGTLVVLPALPATLEAFGHPLQIAETAGQVQIQFDGVATDLRPHDAVDLGGEHALVAPPIDTGHFEPGFASPVPADVTYHAVSYGRLDSRRIAGRAG